jgi:pimeloyl-ACP methyl ester carboxylesterase
MHKILLLPGAARESGAMWPVVRLTDQTLIPVDYERGFKHKKYSSYKFPTKRSSLLISHYAKRVYKQIRNWEGPFDIYGWSMGALVAMGVVRLADKHRPGLVRNIVAITPGVWGGQPLYPFHYNPQYIARMWYESRVNRGRKTAIAVARIKEHIPNFSYVIAEDTRAMLESGSGLMHLPKNFDRRRLHVFYSPEDTVVPPAITLECAKRAGVTPIPIPGFGHDIPLLDVDGTALRFIRETVG